MGFAGELSTIGLPEVFQNVAFNRLTGVLTVRERGREASIFVEDGSIRAFRGDSPLDYATLAENCGAASASAVRTALKRKRRRRSLREALHDHDPEFAEDRYDSAIATALREEVILLFGWKYASFVFEEIRPDDGVFDKDQLAASFAIDPTAIAMEAARRVDEWETISHEVQSERDVFLPCAELPLDQASPDVHEVMARLDGTHDIASIVEELPYGRFHVLRTIADLSERGYVARASSDQLIELARTAEECGDTARALHHLEAALDMDRANLDARRELIRLYERSGRRTDAARQLKTLARTQEQGGDLEGALTTYRRATELAPYETEALERIVNIHDQRGDRGEFMRAGLRLAEALASNGLLEESLDAYQRLLSHDAESVILREALATVYIKLHEPKKAARELLTLARAAWDREESAKALHYYRNVLAVDRTSQEAQARIEEIEETRRLRRRSAHRRHVGMAAATLVICTLAWQGAREWFAQSALHEAARASLGAIVVEPAGGSLVHAIGHYARVAESYPMTRGAAAANATVHSLLLDELHRIRGLIGERPRDAGRALRLLSQVRLPESSKPVWDTTSAELLALVSEATGQ